MASSAVTVAALGEICRQVVATQSERNGDFRATVNQVYFFTLVRLQKQGLHFQKGEDLLDGQAVKDLTGQAQIAAEHLIEWRETVTALKQNDPLEWELLRIQMDKALKSFVSPHAGDALQNALIKVFELLAKIPDPDWAALETANVITLVVEKRTHLTNIYDFRSPFYAFAKLVARNTLRDELRKEGRRLHYLIYLDEMMVDLSSHQSSEPLAEGAMDQKISQLQADLPRLLALIDHHLTPKPRQVVYHTLGARSQFAMALEMINLPWPAAIPRHANGVSDADIGHILGMTENSVRVHRSSALKRLSSVDPLAAYLLETLLKRQRF